MMTSNQVFHPYFGSDCPLGDAVVKAHAEQFSHQGMGTPIPHRLWRQIQARNPKQEFPLLSRITSENMYREACWVREQSSVTYGDLDRYRKGDTSPSNQFGSGYHIGIASLRDNTSVKISSGASSIHTLIRSANMSKNVAPTESEKDDTWKAIKSCVEECLKHPGVKVHHLATLERAMIEAKRNVMDSINNGSDDGCSVDGNECKKMPASNMAKNCMQNDHSRYDSDSSSRFSYETPTKETRKENSERMEWAASTAKKGPREKRKKGAI